MSLFTNSFENAVILIILREAELERINHGAKCTACSGPVYYANNHDWSSRGGRKLREMIYERRNVRRARGFNDSIYVNDNTPSLSAVSRLFLLLFSFFFFYFFLSSSFLLFFTFTCSGPQCCERAASSSIRPRSRKWQMKFRAPPPSLRKKNRQSRNYFFSNSARRIILSVLFRLLLPFYLPFRFARTPWHHFANASQSIGLNRIV